MVLGLSALVQPAAYAANLVGTKVNSGYDAETWEKLQDDVLEYDEIPLLIHEFNPTIEDIWKNLNDSKADIDANVEELESQRRKMENLKDQAEDEGDISSMINYATQEAILDGTAKSMAKMGNAQLNSKSAMRSITQAENQLTIAVQQLMVQYDSLRSQRKILVQVREMSEQQLKLAQNQLQLGLATEADVQKAQNSVISAEGNIQSLDGGLLKMKPLLCSLTGWPADADPQIAEVPPVDLSRMDGMNLEADTWKAIGNNQTLISQRHSGMGNTSDGDRARMGVIEEGDEKMTIEMKRLYDEVQARRAAYDAAATGYQSAKKSAESYERMYQLGLMGKSDYLGAQISCYQKESAFETADMALRSAIEDYEWAVKGFAELGD